MKSSICLLISMISLIIAMVIRTMNHDLMSICLLIWALSGVLSVVFAWLESKHYEH